MNLLSNARQHRDNSGSIAIFMAVMMLGTALILVTLITVERGISTTRRSGDSASALQIADAGVNAAIQAIPNVPSGTMSVGPNTDTVGNGSFEWSAERVTDQLWNVSAIGKDASGVRRRIVAQAAAIPLFGRPIYIRTSGNLKAGTILDSYLDHTTTERRCTRQGNLTVDDPSLLSFTGSGNQANCRSTVYPSEGWVYSMDGCHIPGDDAALTQAVPTVNGETPPKTIIGSSKCPPPPDTKRVSPKLTPADEAFPTNTPPADVGFGQNPPTSTFTCDATNHFQGGKVYMATTLILRHGCVIDNPNPLKPVHAYATNIELGVDSGTASNNVINPPQAGYKNVPTATACTGYTTGDPQVPGGYCAGWPAQLFLHLVGNGTVTFKNKVRFFWGVVSAPNGFIDLKSEQLEAWGAAVSSTFTSGTQFTWHFDESLKTIIGSGRFGVTNWREEALSP